jgi:hypothetical protein
MDTATFLDLWYIWTISCSIDRPRTPLRRMENRGIIKIQIVTRIVWTLLNIKFNEIQGNVSL